MNRAERRHRTEAVRARRIHLHSKVASYYYRFSSDEAHANYLRNWGWRWGRYIPESEVQEEIAQDRKELALTQAKMRNAFVSWNRDREYIASGREKKMKIADYDYWVWLNEAGIPNDRAPRSKQRYYC